MLKMKRKFLVLIILVIIPFCALPQKTEISDYTKFKSYFDQLSKDMDWLNISIPLELASKLIDNERIINEMVQSVHPYAIFEKGECTVFIIEIGYPMGGYTAAFGLLSFIDESMKQTEIIGQTSLTNEGGRQSTINFINDTLIEVISEEVIHDEKLDERKVFNANYNYYIINNEGFCKVEKGRISGARLFPQASNRILDISELKNYQKADLDIMRNEIFADHGYIFKTEKWKKYFQTQYWYTPLFDDVNNKLTIVEKNNIHKILIISEEKR